MKFSSALTLTTVVSVISTAHAAPIPSSEPVVHYRRHSSVSELSGRQFQGADFMESFGAAFEPGNGIGKLLNFIKRQVGSTDSTSASASSSSSASGSSSEETTYNPTPDNAQTDETGGLMGGGLSSTEEAGFAFEPGQGIKAA